MKIYRVSLCTLFYSLTLSPAAAQSPVLSKEYVRLGDRALAIEVPATAGGAGELLFTSGQLLFQTSSNALTLWYGNGSGSWTSVALQTPASGWKLCAIADMNGDGVLDLILQNQNTYAVSIWFMNGNGTYSSAPVIATAGTNWILVGAGDFDGDGEPDLVFQNRSTNQISFWYIAPGGLSYTSAPVIATAAAGWWIYAVADMNQDGVPDLLFQKQQQLSVWYMDGPGGATISSSPIFASAATGWQLHGANDWNGDGEPDLFFQNGSNLSVWYMAPNPLHSTSAPVIANNAPQTMVAAH